MCGYFKGCTAFCWDIPHLFTYAIVLSRPCKPNLISLMSSRQKCAKGNVKQPQLFPRWSTCHKLKKDFWASFLHKLTLTFQGELFCWKSDKRLDLKYCLSLTWAGVENKTCDWPKSPVRALGDWFPSTMFVYVYSHDTKTVLPTPGLMPPIQLVFQGYLTPSQSSISGLSWFQFGYFLFSVSAGL